MTLPSDPSRLTEQERRQRVADAPAQIEHAIRAAHDAGVTESDLRAAMDAALTQD